MVMMIVMIFKSRSILRQVHSYFEVLDAPAKTQNINSCIMYAM